MTVRANFAEQFRIGHGKSVASFLSSRANSTCVAPETETFEVGADPVTVSQVKSATTFLTK